MGDRDALIVICWLAILILVFFECFYRKLKSRFGREIQAPLGFSSLQTTEEMSGHSSSLSSSSSLAQLGMDCGGCGRRNGAGDNGGGGGPPQYSHCSLMGARRVGGGGGGNRSPPFQYLPACKEVCAIRMEMEEGEEEPPPTYEEALSYAKLVRISELCPYGWEEDEKRNKKGANLEEILPPGAASGESDLEEYTSDEEEEEEESESDMDWNNNSRRNDGKEEQVTIRTMRILSSSTSKVGMLEATTTPPPSSTDQTTHVERIV